MLVLLRELAKYFLPIPASCFFFSTTLPVRAMEEKKETTSIPESHIRRRISYNAQLRHQIPA